MSNNIRLTRSNPVLVAPSSDLESISGDQDQLFRAVYNHENPWQMTVLNKTRSTPCIRHFPRRIGKPRLLLPHHVHNRLLRRSCQLLSHHRKVATISDIAPAQVARNPAKELQQATHEAMKNALSDMFLPVIPYQNGD